MCPHVWKGYADGCGGMKVGTEMSGGVSNVKFENSTIDYAGIALKLSAPLPRGGVVRNITWANIHVHKAGMLMWIEDGNSNPYPRPPSPEQIPSIHQITYQNISLDNSSCVPGAARGNYGCGSNIGWLLAGDPKIIPGATLLDGLVLRNVTAKAGDGRALTWRCSGDIRGTQSDVKPAVTCFNQSLQQ